MAPGKPVRHVATSFALIGQSGWREKDTNANTRGAIMGPMELQATQMAYQIHSKLISSSGPELQRENQLLKLKIERLENNIRDLESKYSERIKDLETLILSVSLLDCSNPVTRILDFICKAENVSRDDLIADRRQSDIVLKRHILYYLCCTLTDRSLPSIGRVIRKDHTTIMHGRTKIANLMKTDPAIRAKVEAYAHALVFGEASCPA